MKAKMLILSSGEIMDKSNDLRTKIKDIDRTLIEIDKQLYCLKTTVNLLNKQRYGLENERECFFKELNKGVLEDAKRQKGYRRNLFSIRKK